MSLYAQYLKEREDFEIVENEDGFATFKVEGPECYIRDIYVVPHKRQFGIAAKMANTISEIAKNRGCRVLLGSVSPKANHPTASIKVLLSYGFKFLKADDKLILFSKEI